MNFSSIKTEHVSHYPVKRCYCCCCCYYYYYYYYSFLMVYSKKHYEFVINTALQWTRDAFPFMAMVMHLLILRYLKVQSSSYTMSHSLHFISLKVTGLESVFNRHRPHTQPKNTVFKLRLFLLANSSQSTRIVFCVLSVAKTANILQTKN